MTESEWLQCGAPAKMIAHLSGIPGERKRRLFAIACCRRIQHLIPDPESVGVLAVAESMVFGILPEAEIAAARATAAATRTRWRRVPRRPSGDDWDYEYSGTRACERTLAEKPDDCLRAWYDMAETGLAAGAKWHAELAAACDLIRCIFGDPRRPAAFSRDWLTGDVLGLARAVHLDGAFDALPILADALEEAGCVDAGLLAHCRGRGLHVKGCWAIDLILELK